MGVTAGMWGFGVFFSYFLGCKCVNICFTQSICFSIFVPCRQLELKARCFAKQIGVAAAPRPRQPDVASTSPLCPPIKVSINNDN